MEDEMLRKNVILIIVVLLMLSLSAQEKTTERLGNEAEFAGDEFYGSKDYLKAAEQYELAMVKFQAAEKEDEISRKDKIISILDKLFKSYYFAKSYEKAIDTAQQQLKSDPKNDKIARTIAQIYEKNLKDLNKAIQTLVNFDSANRNYKIEKKIAAHYTTLEDYVKALDWYKKAYELKKDSSVIKNIASLYLKLGKTSEAVKAYEDFLKTNPKESVLAKTYKNMGALYEELKNFSKTVEYFEKSIAMKYDNALTLLLITKYYDNKQFEKANAKIELLLKNKPDSNDAIYYRAMIKYDQDDKDNAKADFEKLINDPKYGNSAKGFLESIKSE